MSGKIKDPFRRLGEFTIFRGFFVCIIGALNKIQVTRAT
jgi:hypothetical protein